MKNTLSLRKLGLLAFLAFAASGALCGLAVAGSASVQTYDPALQGETGVLPEGMEWNHPLKAGDLTLGKPLKKTAKPTGSALAAPSVSKKTAPVGDVKAPQISDAETVTGMPSSANVMLMQGMKNALQQSGQKLTPPQLAGSVAMPAEGSVAMPAEESAPQQTPAVDAPAAASQSDMAANGVAYEPGLGPKTLSAPNTHSSIASAEKAVEDKAALPAPSPLDAVALPSSDAAAPAVAETKSAEPEVSIFGASVSQKTSPSDAKKGGSADLASAKTCEPTVTSWTRTCKEAGYPAGYTGKIDGETRVECPSGDARDVWVSNSCAPAGGSDSKKAPKATDFKQAPPSMAAAARGAALPAAEPEAPVVVQAPAPVLDDMPLSLPDPNAKQDASCGPANGLASITKPAGDLCLVGDSTAVLGDGPWRWTCRGQNGGMTVSCAAPVDKTPAAKMAAPKAADKPVPVVEDGKCGSADGVGVDAPPSQNLCVRGLAGHVNGAGPWTWACSGTNGGLASSCSAPRKLDGACGSAAEEGTDAMPSRNLCGAGFASAVTGNGPWNWTCSGLHGGQAATCSASPKVDAVCGPSAANGHRNAPKDGLCTTGTASAVDGEGPWNWTCSGQFGGAKVSCKAPVIGDGACGPAHGGVFEKAPSDDLCAAGHASRVTGLGPWNWNCSGTDGGNTASCTASLGSKEAAKNGSVACGIASTETRLSKPSDPDLCQSGKSSAVNGSGPYNWSCSDEKGHNLSCSTLPPVDGSCGSASGVSVSLAPVGNLCSAGVPSGVVADKDQKNWIWSCKGSDGSASPSCAAPITHQPQSLRFASPDEPKCGAAAGQGGSKAPSANLCDVGKASAVRGSGSWSWSCALKSGAKVSCEADRQIDGVCGTSNGALQKQAPVSGLCAAGSPTAVQGDGPWLWSCVGAGGGNSASCSASSQSQAKVDGACGAAANSVMTSMPSANLCDSGMPSTVYGEGPWTWTCSGLNSGIAATCTSSKVIPKAPPPPGPPVNGNCGAANGVAADSEPSIGLCSSGTETNVSGNGPWNWSCLGANGGMTVSCTAPLIPPPPVVGVCGSSHGVTTLTSPRSGLCAAGIASAVSGKGPWVWSCSGTNGGAAVSCVAPLAGASGAGVPSPVTARTSFDDRSYASGEEAPAPAAAPVGLVTPRLEAKKLDPMKAGSVPNLKPSKKLELPKEASALAAPSLNDKGLQPPDAAPDLPAGVEPLMPPPIRDTVGPSSSLKPPSIDADGIPVAGSRLQLDPEISTLGFARGSDILDKDAVQLLGKLASVLQSHGNARITLTAYAASDGATTPREARRLSLNRALAIRDYLTSKGISSGRVDVRALGANVPSGDMDRVDVKVN